MTAPASATVAAVVDSGLRRVMADTPVRHGFAQLVGGWSSAEGAFAKAEAGAHLAPGFSAFAFAEASQRAGTMAGLGARWEF